jgi:hypothetical protein
MPVVPDAGRVFLTDDGRPRLVRCALLFLDLLGVGEMATDPDRAAEDLVRVERALRAAHDDILAIGARWSTLLVSDTLVLAVPLREGGEAQDLGGLVDLAARIQWSFLAEDLFGRGGITVGLLHLRDGFVFGPALVDAYALESRHAVHPRIVLSPEAAEILAPDHDPDGGSAPRRLLVDGDGSVFVDYLQVVLEQPGDVAEPLAEHRRRITTALAAHTGHRRVWEKYRWLADYHNATLAAEGLDTPELAVGTTELAWRFRPFADG